MKMKRRSHELSSALLLEDKASDLVSRKTTPVCIVETRMDRSKPVKNTCQPMHG